MQHTEVLELNACITYLRTGKELPRKNTEAMYDMRWTFTAPRDPTVTELYVGSPGDEAWLPTQADLRLEHQRRMKEREEEARRTATPQPQKNNASTVTPVPLSGLRPPIEFKRKPVSNRAQPQKSVLSAELNASKIHGGPSGIAAGPSVPSVKLLFYLPDRTPVEMRIPKTATVEQAIVAVLERSRSKLGKKKPDRYEVRIHDSDGLPDDDFPPFDRETIISETGNTEFCICDTQDGNDDEPEPEEEPEPQPKPTPPPSQISGGSLPPIPRSKSIGNQTIIRVTPSVDLEAGAEYKILSFEPKDATALNVLRKMVRKLNLPLVADEYILVMKEEDRERLMMPLSVLRLSDNLAELGLENVIIQKRKYADSPVDADRVDQLRTIAGTEAGKRNAEKQRDGASKAQDQTRGGGTAAAQVAAGGDGQGKGPHITITEPPRTDATTPLPKSKDSNFNLTKSQGRSTGKKDASVSKAKVTSAAVDPDSILLNEISASRYEEWDVVKTNNWGKHQNRILGIDGFKIYNKARSEGGFGGSVKNAERLIADIESIEISQHNPLDFIIRVREPLGNIAVLNYRADSAEVAARIVAKIKYNKSGQMSRN